MSLLQEIYDEINSEAGRKIAVAEAHAEAIAELEALAETLRQNGASGFLLSPVIHSHYKDVNDPRTVSLSIYTTGPIGNHSIIDALHAADMTYTAEDVAKSRHLDPRTILRINGIRPYIELYGHSAL